MNTIKAEDLELVKRLRHGASISRDRDLNLDFAKIADEAADAITRLQREFSQSMNLKERLTTMSLNQISDLKTKNAELLKWQKDATAVLESVQDYLEKNRPDFWRAAFQQYPPSSMD